MIRWQSKRGRFLSGLQGIRGNVIIADISYSMESKGYQGPRHAWTLNLPGKARRGKEETVELAQAAVEEAFKDWLAATKLTTHEPG